MLIEEKTLPELERIRLEVVVVPLGSFEQHGPHLPYNTDTLIAEGVSKFVAEKINAAVAPTITLGVSPEHMDFWGTVTVKPDTLRKVLEDVIESFTAHGVGKIVVVNAHGGNVDAIKGLESEAVRVFNVTELVGDYGHAGEIETSIMLYLHPKRVRASKIRKFMYRKPEGGRWKTIDYSASGVLGDPTKADRKKGKKYFKEITEKILGML